MKKLILVPLCLTGFSILIFAQTEKSIFIETKNSVLVYSIRPDQKVYQVYLGEKLSNREEYAKITSTAHEVFLPFGTTDLFEPAVRVTHHDGNPSLDLQYSTHHVDKTDNNVTATVIQLKDPQYPFEVSLHFRSYFNENVIEQWVEISHHEKLPVTLFNYASSMLHFNAKDYWLTQFHGDWTKEMRMQESKLTSGIKIIDTKLGARADMYQAPYFYLSLNEPAGENTGEVIAAGLAWTGNFKFVFEIDQLNSLRIVPGVNPFASEYKLQPGKVFTTPSFVFTYSHRGKGAASRSLHRWVRKYSLLDGDQPRYMLLNNWEATYFDFDESKLEKLIGDAAKLDVDLFLLDDGWFANKYPRNDDHAGLGDWKENRMKLPNGISTLVAAGEKQKIKFGIWIEPEMVNPKSELYEKHPEWILKLPNRPEHFFRNQMVLDLTNPKVQDFVFGVVDNLMVDHPGIAYMKWDCNRMMTNMYSPFLKENQSHLFIEYVEGLYKVWERVRQKYPHLPMMLCSGGGGRIDYKALKYFTEYWPSDMTDPLERVYIQWGYSNFLPAIATCNHITSSGKQSLKFHTDVAMMGKVGYDIQIDHMNEKELKFSRDAIKMYKRLSNTIWLGDLYRLVSPYSEDRAVLMYVNDDQSTAVLFSYTLNARFGESFNTVRLQGLSENKNYKVTEVNLFPGTESACPENGKTYSGLYLMKVGLQASSSRALTSSVFEITRE